MQGNLKDFVPADEASQWLEDRKNFILSNFAEGVSGQTGNFRFETSVLTESDEEDIPNGQVMAILYFEFVES